MAADKHTNREIMKGIEQRVQGARGHWGAWERASTPRKAVVWSSPMAGGLEERAWRRGEGMEERRGEDGILENTVVVNVAGG